MNVPLPTDVSALTRVLLCLIVCAPVFSAVTVADEIDLDALRSGFEARRDAAFAGLAEAPLERAARRAPLKPGRGQFTRQYSYSLMNFAFKSLWLDRDVQQANAAIAENCSFYLADKQTRDDRDSFYWSADLLARMVELFGPTGTRAASRIDEQTQAVIDELMWVYASEHSRRAEANPAPSHIWHIYGSENHHDQYNATLWHFTHLLAQRPQYRQREFDDGGTAAEHRDAWSAGHKSYLRERLRKGLCVEFASKVYNSKTLKGFYNMHDFTADAELRRLCRAFLDVFWASWAQEQIEGVRGGPATRIYLGLNSRTGRNDPIARWAGFYLGAAIEPQPFDNDFVLLTSTYRMPVVVMDLAMDVQGRGTYEVRDRAPGLAMPGYHNPPDYQVRDDVSGIVRYSYCTPQFIMGSPMVEARPWENWTAISSQNRWMGVIFAGHRDARIVPECRGIEKAPNTTTNQHWSVQHRGSLVAQKLRTSKAGKFGVWISAAGLTEPVQRGAWWLVQSQSAYAAVRAARDGFEVEKIAGGVPGRFHEALDPWSPIIIEVAPQSAFDSLAAFEEAVLALPVTWEGQVLTYRGLDGVTLTLDAAQTSVPTVDATPIDFTPPMLFDSPFIQSRWNSGIIRISKGERELIVKADAE